MLGRFFDRWLPKRGKIWTEDAIKELGYRKITVTIEEPGKPPEMLHTWRKGRDRREFLEELRGLME
jgi:hypothetical protein